MPKDAATFKKNAHLGWFVLSLTALFYCYEYLLRIQPSAMSADLRQHYGIDEAAFGNLFAIYYYIYTFMQLPVGLLLDRFGLRIALSMACFSCALGTFLFASSHYLWIAQIGRFLIGLGAAFGFVGVLTAAAIWSPKKYFSLIAGLANTLGMLGGLIGNNLIAWLIKEIGWRNTTFLFAAAGILLATLLFFSLSKTPSLTADKTKSKEKAITFKDLGIEVLFLLKKRQFWLIAFIGGILYTCLSVFAELWGVPYLHEVKHLSNQASVLIVSMIFLGWAIGSPLVGFFSNYIRDYSNVLFYGALGAALCIGIALYLPGLSTSVIAFFLFLFALFSSSQVIIFLMIKPLGSERMVGSTMALTNTMVMLVGAILQPVIGNVVELIKVNPLLKSISMYHYPIALLILPLIFIMAAFLARAVGKK
jgi:MFS family permease